VLWEFQTDASKENKEWVLTAERRFNIPLLLFDNWKEGPLVAQIRQLSVGSVFSSPLVAGGTVYFGSTDGFLYAID
jgi:outer membrane protein assembly factor BamB